MDSDEDDESLDQDWDTLQTITKFDGGKKSGNSRTFLIVLRSQGTLYLVSMFFDQDEIFNFNFSHM